MSKNKALGMGLGALLGDNEPEPLDSINELSIEKIFPNPDQPRTVFNKEALQELADSIKSQGVIQPILVENKEHDGYMIIAGERRFRASKIAGLEKIPVIVKKFTEEEKLEIALIENVQREDLSAIEEAKAYRNIIDRLGLSQEELSQKIGKNRSTIANSLRLLKLPETMQQAVNEGLISSGHARTLLSVVNPADQKILFNRITKNKLSVREAEKMSSELNGGLRKKIKEKSVRSKNAELQSIEQQFIDLFGTKVLLKGNEEKGTIEISYFSMDDLERIIDIISK